LIHSSVRPNMYTLHTQSHATVSYNTRRFTPSPSPPIHPVDGTLTTGDSPLLKQQQFHYNHSQNCDSNRLILIRSTNNPAKRTEL